MDQPKITSVYVPAAWLRAGEKLMASKAAGVPTEPGWYWAAHTAVGTIREIVYFIPAPGWSVVRKIGSSMLWELSDFTDWSERLVDPEEGK